MRVAKVSIRNILGIKELEFALDGAVTEISGGNGRGKTSALKAIQAVLGGGNDVTLLRHGAKEGEVVLLLEEDDGRPALEVSARVNEKGVVRKVRHPEFGILSKPQSVLSKLADTVQINPIAFLTAAPKERARILLEVLNLSLTEDQLQAAVPDLYEPGQVDLSGTALEVIERLRKRYFDERTGENRAAKEKRATAKQLAESQPDDLPDPAAEIAKMEKEEAEIREKGNDAVHKLRNEAQVALLKVENEEGDKLIEIDRMIEALKRDREAVIAEANRKKEELRREYAAKEAAIIADGRERIATIRGRLETLREQQMAVERAKVSAEVIARLSAEAAQHEARSAQLTEGIEALDRLKEDLLANLPIPGVEVRDGEVYRNGIPFDHLSESERVRLAIEVARLRAGDLKLACVDGIECMDPETYVEFCRQAEDSGLRFVVTRVTDGDLFVGSPALAEV